MKDNNAKQVRVLFVLASMEIGGVQSGIMNFARITPPEMIQYDVIVLSREEGYHEARFKEYGRVYHLPLHRPGNKYLGIPWTLINDIKCRKIMKRFLQTHESYDVIHTKLLKGTAPVLEAAEKSGVPVRVAQSHVDRPDRLNLFDTWYYKWCSRRIEKSATVKLAVSEKAAKLLFDHYNARIIKNPTISMDRLSPARYANMPHTDIRLIQIGTYSRRKNQLFSVDVLRKIHEMGEKAHLSFVGYSLDEPGYIHQVEERVNESGMEDNVDFLPKDADVPKLLSQSDYMLIPSLREGLPNVALEAQAMGVPCFLSDTIDRMTDCGLCHFFSLKMGADAWAKAIIEYRQRHGAEKSFVDMSSWDQREILKEYIEIWLGQS